MVRPNLHDPGAVLGNPQGQALRAALAGRPRPRLRASHVEDQAGTKERPSARTKELTR